MRTLTKEQKSIRWGIMDKDTQGIYEMATIQYNSAKKEIDWLPPNSTHKVRVHNQREGGTLTLSQ